MLSVDDDDDFDEDDYEGRSQHLYMELQSTVSFKEIDIDKMLEHTTLDDFLRGLYVNSLGASSSAADKKLSQHDRMMGMIS